jgi:hypothetical protein
MATPAQIAANRLNAKNSTGPRSVEGKAASRFNALKHGIDAQSIVIPGEDPAEYEALAESYDDSIHPRTPEERFHVDTMIRADWQKRRLEPLEAELHRALIAELPGASLAAALLSESPTVRLIQRIQKQIAAFDRAWYRSHITLRRSREKVLAAEEAALDLYLRAGAPNPPPPFNNPPELASFPQPAPTSQRNELPTSNLPDGPGETTPPPAWDVTAAPR